MLLKLDMRVKLFAAHPKVKAVCGRVAVMRGPIVYCAGALDHDINDSVMSGFHQRQHLL